MKLKSGCLFWPQVYSGPPLRLPSLDRDMRCEVAIIGAGISGALISYYLMRMGVHTVMVDWRMPGEGSTAASTGLLQYEIDTPLVELIGKIGTERAFAAYRASVESLDAFEPIVDDLGDRCGLKPQTSLYLASEEADVRQLRDECEARRSMGIDVDFLGRDDLKNRFGLERPAALRSAKAFQVDPYCLTLQLIHRSMQRGLEVFTPTKIIRCEPHARGMTLLAGDGARLEAGKVVIATGYETMEFLPRDLCQLASTYAFVSDPAEDPSAWPEDCLIWESARPYLYFRTTHDHRAMVGGEDIEIVNPQLRDRQLPEKTRVLQNRIRGLLPQMKIETSCAWAGTFAQTKDGLPYIGTLHKLPHAYFALGYGGNGIAFSVLAAQIISDSFTGRKNQNAKLFGFER